MKWPLVTRARWEQLQRQMERSASSESAARARADDALAGSIATLRGQLASNEARATVLEIRIAKLEGGELFPPTLPSKPRLHRRLLNALRPKAKQKTVLGSESVSMYLDANAFRLHKGGIVRRTDRT